MFSSRGYWTSRVQPNKAPEAATHNLLLPSLLIRWETLLGLAGLKYSMGLLFPEGIFMVYTLPIVSTAVPL